ncbi:diguanylate cyclase [Pseudomonas sp. MIL19]|uniref:GGDEF domain-containing protein n=1 Tax=Pseudomonas sp. MIL19 TaxID=2976979 RepID=UPI002363D73F|nr:GGDEF domain-containing protein [Pseudomonas sp. MIL19]MDD2159576.1 diguanylate cyclase [Pseudomonas sp. MIL19]
MKASTYVPSGNLVDLLLDAICVVDTSGRFVFVSAACQRIFGYSPDEMVGKVMIEMVHPEDRDKTLLAAQEVMAGTSKLHFENRYFRKDGSTVHILWSARWSGDEQMRIAVAHDITERKRNEALQTALYGISEVAHSAKDLFDLFEQVHQLISTLLPAASFSVALYDEQNEKLSFPYPTIKQPKQVADAGPSVETLSAEVMRNGKTLLLSGHHETPTIQCCQVTSEYCWLGVPLKSHKGVIGALIVQNHAQSTQCSERDQELLQFVSTQVATAIERQQMLSRLQFMAQYDPLTQLPNRELLRDRMQTAMARARREQSQVALLFLDLDKFKQVNDSLGHAAGDLLLQGVAQRIQLCLREADTVARFAGDEFVVLLEDFHSADHASAVAEKIRHCLNQPFDLDGQSQTICPSIGIALYPQHAQDEQQLLQHADNAMYRAKQKGGNRAHSALEPE